MRMAESRRYISNQPLDITQILFEAKHRWLRPNEICEILRNYEKFELTPDPPYKPSGGSSYLFDRKALRYFRKDGHCWRKKKDGKTVREAHEKLKAGSVDVLHCYYAHGEDNENFQRRSYWMLDLQFEHIVLVHYREVKEGNKPGIPHFLNGDPGLQIESTQACSMVPLAQLNSPAIVVQTSYASSPSNVDWNGRTSHSEFEDVDSGDELVTSAICSRSETASLHMHDLAGLSSFTRKDFDMGFGGPSSVNVASPSSWYGNQSSSNNISCLQEQKMSIEQPNGTSIISSKTVDVVAPKDGIPDSYLQKLVKDSQIFTQKDHKYDNSEHADYNNSDKCLQSEEDGMFQLTKEQGSQIVDHMFYDNSGSLMPIAANSLLFGVEKTPIEGDSNHDVSGELKKLDSFGRWMNKELGKDCDDSLMASDSGNYWNALDTQNDEKEVSSLSHHMQLDIDSLGPSLSKEQLFSIRDFSPDWAYSGVGTKVLVSGKLLGDVKQPRTTKWCCMFGEVEIPAEVLSDGVLRCQAPPHTSGRVPFYITCSNRLACSEVREFEYREKPLGKILSVAVKSEPEDEMRLQIRFTKILYLGSVRKRFNCSVDKCDKCITKTKIFSMRGADDCEWGQIEKLSKSHVGNRESPGDAFMQKLLKDRLYEWLATKVHEGDKGPLVLDDEGQGVIHLAAALGYEWALHPIIAAGVSPSFRDAQGRSGLHWAAYYGREETVAALVRLGAAPGAVEDPTSKFPGGRTAADFASSRGHKGIAGYLAEADLTSHLSSLTLKENVLDSVTATIAAEEAVETVEEQTIVPQGQGGDSQRSLKGSLAAVRKSAQAAALIQAAFRARSFRHRQLSKSDNEICDGSTDLAALASLNNKAPKLSHYSNYLHASAVKIQQKYRGWKGRNEYLKIRNRIVKIQAHIRGHQVRKQYKKVVWSVSIVEKAILRWRRKGAGLRGFQPGKTIEQAQQEMEKTDEYEFLRLGRKQKVAGVEKALARVQSMVRYPEAREQYMRLVTNYQKLKSAGEGVSTILQPPNSEKVATDDDLLALPSMTA